MKVVTVAEESYSFAIHHLADIVPLTLKYSLMSLSPVVLSNLNNRVC